MADIQSIKIEIDEALRAENEALKTEMDSKDRLIEHYRALIDTLSRQIDDQNRRLEKIRELTL